MSRPYAFPDALRPIEWLLDHLHDRHLRVVDGSFHLPGSGRDPHAEYAASHIPGAVFFDIDDVCDKTSQLPHMLPSADVFAAKVGSLGIGSDDRVVVYDQPGSCAAPRVWWMLRVFGHDNVSVLDGGLAAWLAAGLPIADQLPRQRQARFTARLNPSRVRSAADLLAVLGESGVQIVDNRPAGRFAGSDPERRATRRLGHVPGACNLPFTAFLDADRHDAWRAADEIAAVFASAGVDTAKPILAYCGSGVTACTTAFAAHLLGRDDVAVYDGSWAEWGNRDDTPIER